MNRSVFVLPVIRLLNVCSSAFLFYLLIFCHNFYPQVVKDQLVAYYPLNGDALDYSGNNYNGNVLGCAGTEDKYGNADGALIFDGIDDYVYIPTDSYYQLKYPFSFAAWVYSGKDTNVIFSNDYQDNRYSGIMINITPNGQASIAVGNGGGIGPGHRVGAKTVRTIPIDRWFHLVWIMRNPQDIDIYFNNQKTDIEYTGSAGSLVYGSQFGTIGKTDTDLHGPPKFYKGKLDEIYLFDKALSSEEVEKLYVNSITGVDRSDPVFPKKVYLFQNYPNPFNPTTSIRFSLPKRMNVSITVYDLAGRSIEELANGIFDAGFHDVEFGNSSRSSGIYLYKLQAFPEEAAAGDYVLVKKMILLK